METRTITQDGGFQEFWGVYPRKVGRIAAEKEYDKARRCGATHAELIEGVRRYINGKPAYQDWCHARTFLSQGRWTDEYDTPVAATTAVDWWEECKAEHGGTCRNRWDHEWLMRERA